MPNGWQAKKPAEELKRRRTDHHGIGRREPLQAGREVGRLAQGQLFLPPPAPHLPHHDQPGMDPQAHGQVHPPLLPQAGIELSHGLDHAQPGPHRPLRIVFMRQGIAKVDQQAIAEILGDMPLKALDHLGAGVLIGPHHLAQVFRVELAGEAVESTRSQNSTVSWRRSASGECGSAWRRGSTWDGWSSCVADGGRRREGESCGASSARTRPDQHAAVLIDREPLALDEFVLQVFQMLVIELELALEGAIGHAPPALEHGNRLVEDLLKGHRPPSLCRCGVQKTVWELAEAVGAFIPHMVDKRKQEVLGARDAA